MRRVLFPSRTIIVALSALMLAAIFSTHVSAEPVHTPPSGSVERKNILNGLRPSVERRVGQRVIFVVNRLRVKDGWAFFAGSARKTNGKTLSDKYLWGETSALLRKSGGRWRVVRWGFATDTSIMDECRRNYPNAPRAIFS